MNSRSMRGFLDSMLASIDMSEERALHERSLAALDWVRASAGRGDRSLVATAEEMVETRPHDAFRFRPSGRAELECAGHVWSAGRFGTPSIGDLKLRLPQRSGGSGRLRFSVLEGASPLTDIGTLQAVASPGTLFQVASQFNCLESPGPRISRVRSYFTDPTQGPRASISAFPATLLRHYAAPAPDGGRFQQATDGDQIELLGSACGPGVAPNGYLNGRFAVRAPDGGGDRSPATAPHGEALARSLESRFDDIHVGLHEDCEVVLGYDWDGAVGPVPGPMVTQVFTSTVAGGSYKADERLGQPVFLRVARQLLRAAYLGTLLSAMATTSRQVVLTLIGGGVFGNPIDLIWDAILWAMDEAEPRADHDLHVVLNGRNLGSGLDLEEAVLLEVRRRGGAILMFDREGLSAISR